jgi:PRTRC genetic system protein E
MGMFTELYPLAVTTQFAMLITADAEHGVMTVSVMPRPHHEAKASAARDLTLTATPEEFDAGFVAALAGYRAKLAPLLEQVEAANLALDAAQAANPSPSQPASKPKPPAKTRTAKPPSHRVVLDAGEGDGVGDENPNEDPDTNWMKNRQPQLF